MSGLLEWSSSCPCCGEPIDLFVDPSLEVQQYVEDCSVCCRPILVSVTLADGEIERVMLDREND